jgi:hypothetical protein
VYEPYHGSATLNAKPMPDGKRFAMRSNLLVDLPPFPAMDSVNRGTFIPVTVNLPARAGATNAVVEFGYGPELYCMQRAEKCVATKATVDESSPFVWPTEAGGDTGVSGASCASGCTIAIPAISGKVLYYRWKYRDASNNVLATSGIQVQALP